MTDLEAFINPYKRFGIDCIVTNNDDDKEQEGYESLQIIILSEGGYPEESHTLSKKFEGYNGFYTKISFDMDGRFIKQGFWE